MYHVEDLSVGLVDNMFDQMMKDWYLKRNLHGYEQVVDEMMHREMSNLLEMANWQRNIYLVQPMEEMSELKKTNTRVQLWHNLIVFLRAVPYDR